MVSWSNIMTLVPWRARYLLMCLKNRNDVRSALRFLMRRDLPISFLARLRYLRQIYSISLHVWCAHTQDEILQVATAALKIPANVEGVLIEAGCYKGGSTAKFSLLARITGRRLVAFDSFEGLPENDESAQRTIHGEVPDFTRGRYLGTLDEVTQNLKRYGDWERCTLVKGWFDQTMPNFSDKIIGGYLDVDLASSTKTCLKFLFPHVQPGGSIFTQDGHLPLVIEVLEDERFWKEQVGRNIPPMEGLHEKKLVRIVNRPS